MAKSYVVGPDREFYYPADPTSAKIIKDVGGYSKLSPEQRQLVKYKTVKSGEDCSDMPPVALAEYLAEGFVIEVGATPVKVVAIQTEEDE